MPCCKLAVVYDRYNNIVPVARIVSGEVYFVNKRNLSAVTDDTSTALIDIISPFGQKAKLVFN